MTFPTFSNSKAVSFIMKYRSNLFLVFKIADCKALSTGAKFSPILFYVELLTQTKISEDLYQLKWIFKLVNLR